jgi:23S rRNA (guanosine2251-2'-O)-methyltransferase
MISKKRKKKIPHRKERGGRDVKKQTEKPVQNPMSCLIPGFHGVKEALSQNRIKIRKILIAEGKSSGRTEEILRLAEKGRIPVVFMEKTEIDALLPDLVHQGVAALPEEFAYTELPVLAELSAGSEGNGLLMAADHITDEGNLGALMRTALFFGTDGLIVPKDRAAGIGLGTIKRSSGAQLHLPVSRVVNMGRTLDFLKDKGFWIIGAAEDGPVRLYDFDWNRNLVLVLGNEQHGLSHTVLKRCDQVVNIPSAGNMASLNVSVAGGVILSEILRQRLSR